MQMKTNEAVMRGTENHSKILVSFLYFEGVETENLLDV